MFDDLSAQVHIQIQPIKMSWRRFPDVENSPCGLFLEAGGRITRHEYSLVASKQPHAVSGSVGFPNRRNHVANRPYVQ